jgi:hypothetical protein
MHEQISSHIAALQSALETTSLTQERKEYIAKAVTKLVTLYRQFRETNESRFGDSIAQVVQSILRELEACPEARKLDAKFRQGLHALHADLGIPRLPLKPAKEPPKPAKASPRRKKGSKL